MSMEKPNLNKRANRPKAPWRALLRRGWRESQWYVIAGLWILAVILGYIGFSSYFSAIGETRSGWTTFYLTLQLFVLESGAVTGPINWMLGVARFLAPAVVIFTVIQAVAAIFYEQVQRMRVRFYTGHIIVCGLGRKGLIIANEFCDLGYRVVVIEQGEDNPFLEQCRDRGAIILPGNAAEPELLHKARAHKADYLVSVCGEDGINAEVAIRARELVRDRRGRALTCIAHIVDLELCTLVREREFFLGQAGSYRLEFFNVFDSGARALLDEFPPFNGIDEIEAGSLPHIMVVGLGGLGESLVVHAARNWRYIYQSTRKKLHVSVIDRLAEAKVESMCLRYPQLEKICHFNMLQLDVESPRFYRTDFLFDSGGTGDVSIAYVCLDDDSKGLSAALALLNGMRDQQVPVVVRMAHQAGLAALIQGEDEEEGGFSNLHTFGLLDKTCKPDLLLAGTVELLARAIHDEYVRSQAEKGFTAQTNPAMVSWEKLPESLKESNRSQADHIGIKLRAVGYGIMPLADWGAEPFEFSPEQIELMAEIEHERWMEERLADGWSYATGEKDTERKTSPYLIPWNALSEEIKEYDRETVRAMPAFLKEAGFQIYRQKMDNSGNNKP